MLSKECILLSDGGMNPWNTANCHLEGTSIKERLVKTFNDKKYFQRVNNSENPFCGPPTEEIIFSKETNRLTVATPEIAKNCFTFLKIG